MNSLTLTKKDKQLLFEALIFTISPEACLEETHDEDIKVIKARLALIKKLKENNFIEFSNKVSLPTDDAIVENKYIQDELLKEFPNIKRW